VHVESDDTWQRSCDQMLVGLRPVSLIGTSGHPIFSTDREPMALFRGGSYLSPMASSCSPS
jgi:hypothetical protein